MAIYLDYAATCPVDPRVLTTMLPVFKGNFGNPACQHVHGRRASEAVETARAQVAALINAHPKEIFFTSGATESNNLALKGGFPPTRPHIITATTEHKAVLQPCQCLEGSNIPVTYLEVDENGAIDLATLLAEITPATGMVSLMAANNETGVLHPLAAIGQICKANDLLFHTDAAQAFGKIPLDVQAMGIDMLSISGHKIYGPKGVGALYVRGGEHAGIDAQIEGGGQECDVRSGTLNVPAIVGLGTAAALAGSYMAHDFQHTRTLRDELAHELQQRVGHIYITGQHVSRLPGTLHVGFPGVRAGDLLRALDGKVSITGGSACSAGCNKPSHVMEAMHHPYGANAVRFTVGRPTTRQEIRKAAVHVANAVKQLRG